METVFGILVGLVVLVFLVVVHELGHAIVSRRNGVVVEEFGIGFPPKMFGKKLKNGTLLSFNWLPLGGFVKLQGEHDAAEHKGDYGAATFWQKTKIMFAGVVVNWLVAVLILTGLALVGLPKIIPDQFSIASDTVVTSEPVKLGTVTADYPAAKAGLKAGDEVISLAGQSIQSSQQLIDVSKDHRGQTVAVVYKHDGQQKEASVVLRDADTADFGATLTQEQRIKATWSAPIVGVVSTAQFTWVTLQGLGHLVADLATGLVFQLSTDPTVRDQASTHLDNATNSVAGPIGILGKIFPAANQAGPTQVLFLAAIISLTLAVMNILPIPALDGGSWFLMVLFRLIKQPLTREREEKIKGIGFMVLMGLIILVTIGDVAKLF